MVRAAPLEREKYPYPSGSPAGIFFKSIGSLQPEKTKIKTAIKVKTNLAIVFFSFLISHSSLLCFRRHGRRCYHALVLKNQQGC
jgi:hypothetical protein